MCSATSCWIMSPCQGNGIINITVTTGPPTPTRGKGIVVNPMGHFPVPSQFQGVQTLIHSHQGIQLKHRHHKGGNCIRQSQNITIQFPSSFHPVSIQFMARLLQKYATLYFAKLLIAGNKTVHDLKKIGSNLQGKRDICMHHILTKCINPNCTFYHAQSKELDAQYADNICTVQAPVMDFIWRHGASYIQVPSPVRINRKREVNTAGHWR